MASLGIIFSIIIPTFNRGFLLQRCLDSLLNQTFKEFEVIVCDDGSTDNTKEIVNSYINILNIKYLYDSNWGGPAQPRNRGISIANGTWICFLDSDDWFFPTKLEEILNYVNAYDFIYHDLEAYSKHGKKSHVIKSRQLEGNITKDLLLNGGLPNSSVCIKTELLKNINGFCEDKKLIAVEDLDCWIRIGEITSKFKYIHKSLGAYYFGENFSISNKQNERLETLVIKHLHKLSSRDQKLAIKTLYYNQAQTCHRICLFKQARSLYLKSFSNYFLIRNLKIVLRYFQTLIGIFF